MNTNLYLYCALTDLDGGCDGGNGEGEAGDGTVSDCRILFILLLSSILQSSSYHPRIFSASSSYHPHILSDVGCGGGVEMEVGGMWEM